MSITWIFPGGKLKRVDIPATAGNTSHTTTVPKGKRWLLLSLRLDLTTDATTADRKQLVYFYDADDKPISPAYSGTLTTASKTTHLFVANIIYMSGGGWYHDNAVLGIMPLLMDEDYKIVCKVVEGVAGDSFSGHIHVLEMDV